MATKIPRRYVGRYLLFIFILLALFVGIMEIKKNANRNNEKLFSGENQINDLVYADIVSITPTSATKKMTERTNDNLEGYFCSCETADGKEFSSYIDASIFNMYIKKSKYSWDVGSRIPDRVDFDTPLRIHGRIVSKKSIVSPSDNSLVFRIDSSDNRTK